MATPPDMTLRLPRHIQKQLADMACSPPPRTRSDAPADSRYHAALAIQYRQRIQGIIRADDVTESSPLPSKRHDAPSAQVEQDVLPPYSDEDPHVDTAACTITVKELSSVDTPTPTPTSSADGENRFFALVTSTTHETMPTRRPHTDVISRITSHFSTSSTADQDPDAIQPAAALETKSRDPCRTRHSSPSKVRRIVERLTAKKDKCRRARQPVM